MSWLEAECIKSNLAMDRIEQALDDPATRTRGIPHLRRFELAELAQTQSAFMRKLGGAPELRLQIFSYLVYNNGEPLQGNTRMGTTSSSSWFAHIYRDILDSSIGDVRKNFSFAPNILAVCQRWYCEAADILYLKKHHLC